MKRVVSLIVFLSYVICSTGAVCSSEGNSKKKKENSNNYVLEAILAVSFVSVVSIGVVTYCYNNLNNKLFEKNYIGVKEKKEQSFLEKCLEKISP